MIVQIGVHLLDRLLTIVLQIFVLHATLIDQTVVVRQLLILIHVGYILEGRVLTIGEVTCRVLD